MLETFVEHCRDTGARFEQIGEVGRSPT